MDLHRPLNPPEGANDGRNLRSLFVAGFWALLPKREQSLSKVTNV